MVFVFLEGYAFGAPSYTTCPDANPSQGLCSRWGETRTHSRFNGLKRRWGYCSAAAPT